MSQKQRSGTLASLFTLAASLTMPACASSTAYHSYPEPAYPTAEPSQSFTLSKAQLEHLLEGERGLIETEICRDKARLEEPNLVSCSIRNRPTYMAVNRGVPNATAILMMYQEEPLCLKSDPQHAVCAQKVSYISKQAEINWHDPQAIHLECTNSRHEMRCSQGELADFTPQEFGLPNDLKGVVKACVPPETKASRPPSTADIIKGDLTVSCGSSSKYPFRKSPEKEIR